MRARVGVFCLLLLCISGMVVAQVATGNVAFATVDNSSLDRIDLGNLNMSLAIPVQHKAGRGMPFSYDLIYNSSFWYPAGVSGSQTWQPTTANWGWVAQTAVLVGYVTNSVVGSSSCIETLGGTQIHYTTYSNYKYYDSFGGVHSFAGSIQTATPPPLHCPQPGPTAFSTTATDGSGITLTVSGTAPSVRFAGGNTITPPLNTIGAPASTTDTNGNQISLNSSGVFTDTLGQTALTVAGAQPNPVTLKYTAPSGALATYTITFSSRSIKTNFGCSVGNYGPTNIPLIDKITLPDGTFYQFGYEPTVNNSGYYTGRLASITLPTGGQITYQYTASDGSIPTDHNAINCSDGSALGIKRVTPDGTWTYTRTPGSGAAWTTLITDPANNQTRLQFQGIYQTKKEVFQGAATGTPLQTIDTCYNGNTAIGTCTTTAITLPITRKTEWASIPNSSGVQNKTDTFFNSYALVTEVDQYDLGAVGAGPGSLLRKTITSYAALSNGIVDHPSSVTVYDGVGSVKAQTTYGYDETAVTTTSGTPQHVAVGGSRGNTTTVHQSTGSTTLSQSFTYYDTGNVKVSTDLNGAETSFTYGACGNSFPTVVTLPTVSTTLTRLAAWNCVGGVSTSTTDENGNVSYTNYTTDPDFWRPESSSDTANNTTTYSYSFVSNPGPSQFESKSNFNAGASTVDVLTTSDSLGRTKLTQQKQGPASANFDSVQTDYDAMGRVWKQYLPFQAIAGSPASSFLGSTTGYDSLGRPTSVTDSGLGTVTYTYTNNDVYQSIGPAPAGEFAKRKQFEYDGLGRLTSVCEITSGINSGTCTQTAAQTGYWTRYTYDALGNLTGVSQNAQGVSQSRSFAYDQLGRLTSETNPENGTITYTFDSDTTCGTSKGDLVRREDSTTVHNVTCYHYDALHRLTSVTYPSGSYASVTPSKYYVYDSATINGSTMANPKNRLVEAYTCTSCSPLTKITDLGFSYSSRGETTDVWEWTTNSGGWYHVNGTYWASGALNQLSASFAPITITYGADGEGRVSSVTASTGVSPVAATTYNVAGQVTEVTLGSGDIDRYAYDPNTGRMTQYKFIVGANPLNVIGNLGWNLNGSLGTLGITDQFNPTNNQSCTYSHDDLSRISGINCGTLWSQTFGFDPFGNISKDGSSRFLPTYYTSSNRIASLPSAPPPTYDNNGNLLTITDSTNHTFSWDAEGNQLGIDTQSATYDALSRLVEISNGGVYTQTVYGLGNEELALMNGQTLQKSFVATPSGTAVYNSSGLSYYRHSDWLGSSRFASDASARTMYSSSAYAPFGEQYASGGPAMQISQVKIKISLRVTTTSFSAG